MKETLISILSEFADVFLQGTISESYPQKFITFFTTDSNFDAFYNDDANQINWFVSVVFYSTDPSEVLSVPPQIISALKVGGFIPENAGIDVMCDEPTHTGWAMDFIYPENIEKEGV